MGSTMETQKSSEFLSNRTDITEEVIANWRIILTPEEIQTAVKRCAEVINEKFHGKKVAVVCILKGAVYFFVDLTRYLTVPYTCYFIEASSYHNSQTQSGTIEIKNAISPIEFAGKHVILLDELFDNGHTILQIKNTINKVALVPLDMIYTCTLFKKNKKVDVELPNLHGVTVPDVWLVGYGLDDQQEKRGWTYLYACPKCVDVPTSPDDILFTDIKAYQEMRHQMVQQLN